MKLMDLVIGTYANEPCRICRRNIERKDLQGLIFTGYTTVNGKVSRASHGQCWNDLSPAEKDMGHPRWAGEAPGKDSEAK